MRNGISRCKGVLNALSIHRGVKVAALMVSLLIAPQIVLAKDGGFSLHGSIVNSSCAVTGFTGHAASGQSRRLEVAPGINLQVSTEHNVCGSQVVPFATTYQVLPVVARIDGDSHQASAALVTLSYQ
ncbi:hypothetical protein ACTACJ_01465 [Pseudomonas syringae]|uniref:hypothetical protein n=1 Tax=Pseudomonas syringae TaxID=317 RepID=UPI003F841EBE